MFSEPKVVELYNLYSVENRKIVSNPPLGQFLIQCIYFFSFSTILPILLSFVTTFVAALPLLPLWGYRVAYHFLTPKGGKKMVIGYG